MLEQSEASRRVGDLHLEISRTILKNGSPNPKKVLTLSEEGLKIAWRPEDISEFEKNRSWALQCFGRYDEALAALDRAQQGTTVDFKIWLMFGSRADIKEKQGDLAAAIEEYNKMIAYYFQFTQGSVEKLQQNFMSALGDWRKRAELQLKVALSAEPHLQQALFDEMISGFDTAIRVNPRFHRTWTYRGDLYLKLERYELALTDYKKALSLAPAKSPDEARLKASVKKTQKLVEKSTKNKQSKLQSQTRPASSTPPASKQMRGNNLQFFPPPGHVASAPPPGLQTLANLPPPYQPGATGSDKACAPVMGEKTQEVMARQSHREIPFGEIPFREIQIVKELGRGGMGIVYRATWKSIGVAVKKILDPNADPESIKREHSFISKTDHPNIIFSQGFTTGIHGEFCLVMELHPKSLTHYLTQENHPLKRRVFCAIGVARGLEYLHGCRILHRDLKTDNVLISADRPYERAIITDFGIARELDPDQTHKYSHYAAGTVTHIAPEVLAPRPGELPQYSQFSDVYADALVNWSCLTRQLPFANMDAKTIIKAVAEKDQRPAIPEIALENEMPGFVKGKKGIAQLLRRGWDRDPKQRPTAKEVGDAFETIYAKMK
ncbi:MAG TPA: protein kinase [Gammaproteobacteria bacterium]|nr:protein kinase [Gammaproteobacteria bacterium]